MNPDIGNFLNDLMRRRHRLPSQLAAALGISHPTVIRWLTGASGLSTGSCRKLAEYSGVSVHKILSFAGHVPAMPNPGAAELPEFREYAQVKYPKELDEDLVAVIEELIERRRSTNIERRG